MRASSKARGKSAKITFRQGAALAVPPLLLVIMVPAFQWSTNLLGYPGGYLLGFVIYWGGWCILVPAGLLGGLGPLLDLFREGKPNIKQLPLKMHAALWWPLAFPLAFIFLPKIGHVSASIITASVLLGIVIAVTEELLWRGMYIRLFPDNAWLNTLYPSVGFALWHVAPQLVRSNSMPGGMASFVIYAFVLGLLYAYYARKTGSIRWSTVSHAIHDSLGLGGVTYAAWLG
ncbi:MAG: CPBP family intramembrane glutamic endopeptidase [Chloroflexota bacterium]